MVASAGDDDTVTWRELWVETTRVVGDRVHARWLCEVASGSVDADEFVARLDEAATVRMVSHLDAMTARLRAGEPLQYVLGEWGFRRITLAIDPRVLIPRPETELVAEVALEKASAVGPPRVIADLGTGSGAIGLSLAHELPLDGTTVWITDASLDALDVARANISGLGRAGVNVRVAHGSWLDALPDDLSFDVIVSNPPYVGDDSADLQTIVADWEPHDALFAGPDGLDDIRRIITDAPTRLRSGGWLVLEIGFDQGGAAAELLRAAGYVDVQVRPDLAGLDRVALGRWP